MTTPQNASDGANKDHNIADVNKLIRECAKEMAEIKASRKSLNEQAGKIRERISNAGQQTKAFEFACKLAEMDIEARNEYMDSLKVANAALGIGEQLMMLPPDHGEHAEAAHEVNDPDATKH